MTRPAPHVAAVRVRKPAKTRVRWTTDEQQQVVKRAHELLLAAPRMPMFAAARRAQEEVLPVERWRVIRQHKDVERWMSASAATAPAEPKRRYPRAIQPALPLPDRPRKAPESKSSEQSKRTLTPIAESGSASTRDVARPEAQTFPAIVQPGAQPPIDPAVVRAVAEQVMPMLAATVDACTRELFAALTKAIENAGSTSTAAAAVTDPHPKIAPPPRTRLPRVCVVGLINQQENDVSAAFEGAIEFVFVKAQKTGGTGHGGAGMLTKGSSADVVIAMTDFIGHDVEASAKHLHVPFERVKGSVSALKRWLSDWLATAVQH
ncbi:hypothetical protein [Paraburkholderia youngii]|uniref:hypothetical protein n=1 Tax=Paraburkholderia youngii TaxID=2782701 RepID=UPI003D20D8B6